MIWEYPATYTDRRGSETTVILNDSHELTISLREVTFAGVSFDGLEPRADSDEHLLQKFTLHRRTLCACRITCQIPISTANGVGEAILDVDLTLGEPVANGGLNRAGLLLTLNLDAQTYRSSGKSGWFEGELLELQKAMPGGNYFKACIGCGFSDYSPYGHGLFGFMVCFRNSKEEYLRVKSKDDLFDLWNRNAGCVQETFLRHEFEKRHPGAGYRG
jgi:hypothetical protein